MEMRDGNGTEGMFIFRRIIVNQRQIWFEGLREDFHYAPYKR